MRVFSFKAGKGARGGAPKCQMQIVLLRDLAIKPCQVFDCNLALPGAPKCLVEPQPGYQRLPRNGGGGLTGGALLNPCVVAQGLPVPSFR